MVHSRAIQTDCSTSTSKQHAGNPLPCWVLLSCDLLFRKDNLHRRMITAKKKYGEKPFSFWPKGFNLEVPQEFAEFRRIYEIAEPGKAPIYIIKRPDLVRCVDNIDFDQEP